MTRAQRFEGVIGWFTSEMPIAETELHYTTPFELLVAVVLSAQCTDKRVNMVTPRLFMEYPTAERMAEASPDELFDLIRSISYPNSKAKHLSGLARMLVHDFGGEVPQGREELMKLPGVGRKTANVISSVIFDEPTMAVDTHVFRVSERIGLTTRSRSPLQTEEILVKYIPQGLIPKAHHWLILHGRYVCLARKPKCAACGLTPWCRYYERKSKEVSKAGQEGKLKI
ncbi:MAG: endonuclease III [Porphyromonadaceae bacterium]|nr:endonuclease III [Porphyromonadaceae bacterium]